MEQTTKQKLLGQYFSGNRIADALFGLLGKPSGKSVIDPMCGQADLLLPFRENNYVKGIELDKSAYNKAVQTISQDAIIEGNAFAEATLKTLILEGYDVVITNPPFIRRENYKKSIKQIEGSLPTEQVCTNLINFVKKVKTLNPQQAEQICTSINTASGLSDIAFYSLILCVAITKVGGTIALVVPSTWMGREYAIPFVELLKELFEIEYIVNDVNSVWFEGIAQVKTSLIIAKRTNTSTEQNCTTILDVYREALSTDSIFSFLSKEQSIIEFLETRQSIPHVCEMQIIHQKDLAASQGLNATSKLIPFCTKTSIFTNMEALGVLCGQGFRSGANACFVFEKKSEQFVSKIDALDKGSIEDYFVPIIQNQKVLGNVYSVTSDKNLAMLLYVDNQYARAADIKTIESSLQASYVPLPQTLDNYLSIAESYEIKGTPIPLLSAVKTNIRHDVSSVSFWYNLPTFTPRHKGHFFIPRVNGSSIIARKNPNSYVVDANFITFWTKKDEQTDWILALLNSTWFAILCEETGIVMGGGALKLDAVQLKKIPIPLLDKNDVRRLNSLGQKLSLQKAETAESIISQIDKIIFGKVGACDVGTLKKIKHIKDEYISRRI